jgi:transposase
MTDEAIPHGVEVFVGIEPIDLRWGFDRLAGVVTERLGLDARSRALFLFSGKRRDALKVIFFDDTGLCLSELAESCRFSTQRQELAAATRCTLRIRQRETATRSELHDRCELGRAAAMTTTEIIVFGITTAAVGSSRL